MRKSSISSKLIISYTSLGLFTVFVISIVFYFAFKIALIERTSAQLSSINVLKRIQIENYVADKINHHEALNEEVIQEILLEKTGMGNTGETYLVGEDFRMMSRSRFIPEKDPKTIIVKTEAVINSFSGKAGVNEISDYRGKPVLSAYSLVNTGKIKMAIVSEMDYDEFMTPIFRVRNYILIISLALTFVIVLITIVVAKKIASPISRLKDIIDQLSQGVIPHDKIVATSSDEIGEITCSINDLIDSLRKNVRERSAALLEGEEKERKRLARELHDGIGQMLTAIRVRLNLIGSDDRVVAETKKIIDDTVDEVKRISRNLMPAVLVDLGIKAAFKSLVDQLANSRTEIVLTFEETERIKHLSFDAAISLYRVAQEALNNSLNHSEAKRIEVKLRESNGGLEMMIIDDGKGLSLDPSAQRIWNGIKNMEERVKILGGKFEVNSVPGKGTTVGAYISFDKI